MGAVAQLGERLVRNEEVRGSIPPAPPAREPSCGSSVRPLRISDGPREEGDVLQALRTPEDIQQFVIGLHANFEEDGDTLRSVRGVRHRKAHCIEAARPARCGCRVCRR